ncbi:MAG TPA: hypothetical protein VLB07_02145 [Woeseiaceae bacterium]|nr:hypothetical protein [Woeseiaceae bacterium]
MKLPARLEIARRYCGPPKSANGGYACGRLAAFIEGDAEVTLRSPPPLDKAMQVVTDDGGVALYDGDKLIGSAKPCEITVDIPPAPAFDEAHAAEQRTIPEARHNLPTCFVCGPQREPGDGLRIHVGPLHPDPSGWSGPLAATWIPRPDLADTSGLVRCEFVWAALDCPTGYAAGFSDGNVFLLLGRQSVAIYRRPRAGERCIVRAQEVRRDGRKHHADGVLYGEDRQAIAVCKAVWIAVDPEVMRGDV